MSFEGYYQALCERGHLRTCDVHEVEGVDPERFICEVRDCGGRLAWWNLVDVTNGSFEQGPDGEETTERIDGYIMPPFKTMPVWCTCTTCGTPHITQEATYHVPDMGGHKV